MKEFSRQIFNPLYPSPADVKWIFNNASDTALTNAGTTAAQFFKNNASVTVVTTNARYVITIADWTAFANLGTTEELTDTFRSEGGLYKQSNPNATNAEASEYALLKTFGNTINLYKASLNSTAYKPLQINTNKGKVEDKPC